MSSSPPPKTSDQWIRKISLTLAPAGGGKSLDFSEFHIKFATKHVDNSKPNTMEVRVWGVTQETATNANAEFQRVILQAGYKDGNFGVIFDGTIKSLRWGREKQVDTYMDIQASGSELGHNFSICNQTLAAGSTPADRMAVPVASLKKHGVKVGHVDIPAGACLPRGKVCFGMTRDILEDACRSTYHVWSIQNGKFNVTRKDGYLPGEAVVLTAKTGLIGIPEQTQGGITAKCLLNPLLIVPGMVKIDNSSIARMKIDQSGKESKYKPRIANDGFYRLIAVEHSGGNVEKNFYSALTCIALGDPLPPPKKNTPPKGDDSPKSDDSPEKKPELT